MTWNSIERVSWASISATPAVFILHGGQYALTLTAAWGGGSATLQRLAAGSTYVTCLTAFTADGYATVNLPNGTYKLLIATATALSGDLCSIVTTL